MWSPLDSGQHDIGGKRGKLVESGLRREAKTGAVTSIPAGGLGRSIKMGIRTNKENVPE